MTDTKQICESIKKSPMIKTGFVVADENQDIYFETFSHSEEGCVQLWKKEWGDEWNQYQLKVISVHIGIGCDLNALVAENEALKERLANTLNNHGDLYTLLRHYPNALAEVRQIPDVIEWWLDKAYGVTPCVMVRYDREDPKTERIRVGDQSDLRANLATAVEANRYALATFRALNSYTFEDSDHGLLIAEAVKKLEAFHDEGGEQR